MKSLLSFFNPMTWIAKFMSPGQFNSLARTALKAAGGFLSGLGFSASAVSSFEEAAAPIVAGLISLLAGSIMSFVAEKKKK